MTAQPPERVLIVEDETQMARALERFFRSQDFAVVVSRSVAEARSVLEAEGSWAAFVIDVGLPDGDGLELLEQARSVGLRAPALVLTARSDVGTLQRAQLHAAQFLPKPPPRANLEAFVEWVREREQDHSSALKVTVGEIAAHAGLSRRETDVVLLASRGIARADLASAMGVKETTVRTLIRRALQKTDHEQLKDLVRDVHAAVFT